MIEPFDYLGDRISCAILTWVRMKLCFFPLLSWLLASLRAPGGAQSALDAGLRVLAVATTGPATKLTHATRVEPNLAEVTPDKLLEWFP